VASQAFPEQLGRAADAQRAGHCGVDNTALYALPVHKGLPARFVPQCYLQVTKLCHLSAALRTSQADSCRGCAPFGFVPCFFPSSHFPNDSNSNWELNRKCPGCGWDRVFLPVAAVFWIQHEENADNTDVFSCCCEIKDFLPVPHIQLTSRCAGAGRERSQAASPSWSTEVFHTMDVKLSL